MKCSCGADFTDSNALADHIYYMIVMCGESYEQHHETHN